MESYNWCHFSSAKYQRLLLFTNTHSLPGWLYLEPLKDFWIEQREDHHLLQRWDVSAQTSDAVKAHLRSQRGLFQIIFSLFDLSSWFNFVCVPAAYCLVYLHGVHICQAGSNLHPVLMDSQQVFFNKVHRQTSARDTWNTWASLLTFIISRL